MQNAYNCKLVQENSTEMEINMSELIEKLKAYGMDEKSTMERFLNDEGFYEDCFLLLLEDDNFDRLKAAIDSKNYTAAFDAAHTLKGVIANLGLTPLLEVVCVIVEALRRNDYSRLDEQYNDIIEEMKKVRKLA